MKKQKSCGHSTAPVADIKRKTARPEDPIYAFFSFRGEDESNPENFADAILPKTNSERSVDVTWLLVHKSNAIHRPQNAQVMRSNKQSQSHNRGVKITELTATVSCFLEEPDLPRSITCRKLELRPLNDSRRFDNHIKKNSAGSEGPIKAHPSSPTPRRVK